jgi:hypothetical protein
VGIDLNIGGTTASEQVLLNLTSPCFPQFTLRLKGVGAMAIIDGIITDTNCFVRTSKSSNHNLNGSLVLNNIKLKNVPIAVGGKDGGKVVLHGGTTIIASWAQGNVYTGSRGSFKQEDIPNFNKPSSLLDGTGKIFGIPLCHHFTRRVQF